jgi:hypothetical protein
MSSNFKVFPHSNLVDDTVMFNVKFGFCLSIFHLILPIKPVFFPVILGGLSVATPLSCFVHGSSSFYLVWHTFKNKSSPAVVLCEILGLANSSTTFKDSVTPLMTVNNWTVSHVSFLLYTVKNTLFFSWLCELLLTVSNPSYHCCTRQPYSIKNNLFF